jgi:hypothetical protein
MFAKDEVLVFRRTGVVDTVQWIEAKSSHGVSPFDDFL